MVTNWKTEETKKNDLDTYKESTLSRLRTFINTILYVCYVERSKLLIF